MTSRCSDTAPSSSLLQFIINSDDSLRFTIKLIIIQQIIGMPPLVEEENTPANPDFYFTNLYQFPERMNYTISIKLSP